MLKDTSSKQANSIKNKTALFLSELKCNQHNAQDIFGKTVFLNILWIIERKKAGHWPYVWNMEKA